MTNVKLNESVKIGAILYEIDSEPIIKKNINEIKIILFILTIIIDRSMMIDSDCIWTGEFRMI